MNNQKGGPLAAASAIMPSIKDLSQLFGEHHRRVLTAAYRITGSMADAEDVAQAVFLRLASADRPVANAGSYLYRAAINGALDLLRRRKTASTEPLEDAAHIASTGAGSSPDVEASSSELGDLLRLAISELPPRAAEMFTLRYLEEFGNREIAVLMETSQAVVAVTLHNARSRLKKRLKELDGKINGTK
jgi:RNA polymerase sigma factor (sigma-70 family)